VRLWEIKEIRENRVFFRERKLIKEHELGILRKLGESKDSDRN
jgi:hypothetical protein